MTTLILSGGSDMWKLSSRSLDSLKGVRPELSIIVGIALVESPYDFVVTEGVRTKERQEILVNTGKSRTMNSKHLTGDAIDIAVIVDGDVTWDMRYYEPVAKTFLDIADRLGFNLEWGGNWKTFKDGPHFQIA